MDSSGAWIAGDDLCTGWRQFSEDASPDGHQWGVGGSLGATVRIFHGFAIEPFVAGGYQWTRLGGKGTTSIIPPPVGELQVNKSMEEWFVSGGLSILLDL